MLAGFLFLATVIPAKAAIGFTQFILPPCGEGVYPALAG